MNNLASQNFTRVNFQKTSETNKKPITVQQENRIHFNIEDTQETYQQTR